MSIKKLYILFYAFIIAIGLFDCHAVRVLVAFVGDSAVGKTSILRKMLNKDFDIHGVWATGSAEWYLIHSSGEDNKDRIIAIDTSGKMWYRTLIPQFIKRASMSVVCASIADEGAYEYGCIENIPMWVKLCRESTKPGSTILLAINKSNEPGSKVWEAQEKRVREIADELSLGVIFVNAETGDNIDRLKSKIIEMCPILEQEISEEQGEQKSKRCLLI